MVRTRQSTASVARTFREATKTLLVSITALYSQ